jgi:uncharacterized membrane protein YdbT with pleckstrin-like domain
MKLLHWIKDIIIESLNQTWTLLGMFVAWCVLTGSARSLVGYAIIISLVIWLITLRLREPLDEQEDETQE